MKLIENPVTLKNVKLQEKLQEALKGIGLYLSSVRIINEKEVEQID